MEDGPSLSVVLPQPPTRIEVGGGGGPVVGRVAACIEGLSRGSLVFNTRIARLTS